MGGWFVIVVEPLGDKIMETLFSYILYTREFDVNAQYQFHLFY